MSVVNYIKKIWKDAPSTDTPINAENLNHIETGIYNNSTAINQLDDNLTASDNLKFKFKKSGSKYGYLDANGNFIPFDKVQASKTVTAGTSNKTVTPDSGYSGIASVTVAPTPSQSKTLTASRSAQTVTPDSGKLLSSVTVNGLAPSGTYTASSRGSSLDMGASSNYRYVNTNSVPNSNSGTYTVTSNGTKDMGATNSNRYVNVDVTPTHNSTSPTNYVGYSNENKTAAGNSWSEVSIPNSTSSTYGGACGVKLGNATVTRNGNTVTITIPETIRCGNRFGLESSHSDFDRNITVTLNI